MSKNKRIGGSVKIKSIDYIIADPTKENSSSEVCFLVESKYYRLSAGSIIYDHYLKKYVLKTSITVENGIVGINDNDTPLFGSFSQDPELLEEDFVYLSYKKTQFLCLSEDIFEDTNWQEQLSSNIYYRRTDLPVNEFNKLKSCNPDFKRNLEYNAASGIAKASKIFNRLYSPSYNKFLSEYPKLSGNYTFGLEFETVKGNIPLRKCKKLGLLALRDGSIEGIEYVTIPHKGKRGIQAVLDTAKELKKRTVYDKNCSLHVHVGNIPRTEEFFIALTKILCVIQDEIYLHFPFCLKGGYHLKKKDYTAPLPATALLSKFDRVVTKANIKENFAPIFEFLSMGIQYSIFDSNLNKVHEHPSDPRGNSKWNIVSRYHWVNMIPLLFGNKQTVEFRIHTPTACPDKIVNFMILCFAIVDMAKRSKKGILDGTIGIENFNKIDKIIYPYLTQFGEKYSNLYERSISYWRNKKGYVRAKTLKGDFYANEDDFKSYSHYFKSTDKNDKSIDGDIEMLLKGVNPVTFQSHTNRPPSRIAYQQEQRRFNTGTIGLRGSEDRFTAITGNGGRINIPNPYAYTGGLDTPVAVSPDATVNDIAQIREVLRDAAPNNESDEELTQW